VGRSLSLSLSFAKDSCEYGALLIVDKVVDKSSHAVDKFILQ
jgi:hypothetical protein